jgi:hypothetical protein
VEYGISAAVFVNFCKILPIPSPLSQILGRKEAQIWDSYAWIHWKVYTDVQSTLNWRNSVQSFTEIQNFHILFQPNGLTQLRKKTIKNQHCDSLRPTTPDILHKLNLDRFSSPTYRALHTAIQDGRTNSFANTTFRSSITFNKHPSATLMRVRPPFLLISSFPFSYFLFLFVLWRASLLALTVRRRGRYDTYTELEHDTCASALFLTISKSLIRVLGYITTFWTFKWKICISQKPGTEIIWIIHIRYCGHCWIGSVLVSG